MAVRNVRREAVDKIKLAEKDKDIGKDDSKGFQVAHYVVFFPLFSCFSLFSLFVFFYLIFIL